MVKNLRLLFVALLCAVFNVSMAEEIDFSTLGYQNADDVTEVAGEYATLTFSQGEGSNAPKYYTTGSAVRLYGGNTLTISSTKTISSVVFTCASSNPITANNSVDVGSFDLENSKWTGSATSFTITNTATSGHWRIQVVTINYADGTVSKLNPGLKVNNAELEEGESMELTVTTKSNGAITFESNDPDVAYVTVSGTTYTLNAVEAGTCTITVKQAETNEYNAGETTFTVTVKAKVAPGSYPTVTLPYEEALISSQGSFTIEDVQMGGLTAVWKTSSYGMTANGYNCTSDVESWFVSPLIDASQATSLSLTFEQNLRYFASTDKAKEQATLWVREGANGTWTQLTIPEMENVDNNNFSSAGNIDLSAYAGKTIQLGFKYVAISGAKPGRWEIKNLAVTAEQAVQKDDPELSFSEESFTAYLNEENTFPTLNNPHNLTVAYSSTNPSVATINENGVTLVGEGNTTIKASFEGDENYNEGSAQYTLIVRERPIAGTVVYELVTDVADLADGDEIIIVNEDNTYAIANRTSGNNRPAESVALEDDGTIKPNSVIARITLEGEDGAWNFKVTTGAGQGYLYAPGGGNYLRTQDKVDENATATISIDEESVATVIFQNPTDTRKYLRFNPNETNNNPLFSCYAENSSVTGLVRIYKQPTTTQQQPAGLEYSATEFTYIIGGENEAFPTLSNPNKLTVTYTSSDETVATVGRDGVVTPKAAGKTVIKAESEENDNFKAGSASYTLTVEEVFVGKTYELVTNANVLKAGDNIIIVSPTNDYAISTNQQKNNRTGVAVTLNEDNTITSTADVAAIVLGGEKDAWTFETNGGYLYAPATGNHLRTSAELPEAGGEAKITINAEGNADVEFNIEGQNMLRFNMNGTNENRLFSCYSATSSINTPVRIYREVSDEVEVEITEAGYATMYYGKKNLAVPAGVTATTWTADKDGMKVSKTYNANDIVPAGEAVVLQGEAGIYSFAVAEKAAAEPDANNMLLGFDDAAETVGPNASASYLFYILSTNKDGEEVGFYFKEDEGAAFVSAPHKAYLAVPADVAAGFYTFDGATDGINSVANMNAENNEVYSLSGVRMNGKLQKGIYIVNGKKVVIK